MSENEVLDFRGLLFVWHYSSNAQTSYSWYLHIYQQSGVCCLLIATVSISVVFSGLSGFWYLMVTDFFPQTKQRFSLMHRVSQPSFFAGSVLGFQRALDGFSFQTVPTGCISWSTALGQRLLENSRSPELVLWVCQPTPQSAQRLSTFTGHDFPNKISYQKMIVPKM